VPDDLSVRKLCGRPARGYPAEETMIQSEASLDYEVREIVMRQRWAEISDIAAAVGPRAGELMA
jgi:hypothetical protein